MFFILGILNLFQVFASIAPLEPVAAKAHLDTFHGFSLVTVPHGYLANFPTTSFQRTSVGNTADDLPANLSLLFNESTQIISSNSIGIPFWVEYHLTFSHGEKSQTPFAPGGYIQAEFRVPASFSFWVTEEPIVLKLSDQFRLPIQFGSFGIFQAINSSHSDSVDFYVFSHSNPKGWSTTVIVGFPIETPPIGWKGPLVFLRSLSDSPAGIPWFNNNYLDGYARRPDFPAVTNSPLNVTSSNFSHHLSMAHAAGWFFGEYRWKEIKTKEAQYFRKPQWEMPSASGASAKENANIGLSSPNGVLLPSVRDRFLVFLELESKNILPLEEKLLDKLVLITQSLDSSALDGLFERLDNEFSKGRCRTLEQVLKHVEDLFNSKHCAEVLSG